MAWTVADAETQIGEIMRRALDEGAQTIRLDDGRALRLTVAETSASGGPSPWEALFQPVRALGGAWLDRGPRRSEEAWRPPPDTEDLDA